MIKTEKLTKKYDHATVVDSLDLAVGDGELFGFLGPNGAGKTTTIRMLTTLTRPTAGHAFIKGIDVVKQQMVVRSLFGVVQQHTSLDRELTAWENLELHARLHHIEAAERRRRIAELLDYVDLTDQARRRVEDLSGGMKRRVMIARALLHRPGMIFLDEPTVGLDAQSRRRLWELIRRMNSDGASAFLTTHYIEEAEALCHRVGIIHQGKLIALGTPLELRQRVGIAAVEAFTNGNHASYHYFPDRDGASAYAQGIQDEMKTVTVRDTNLEDVFIELTGRKVGEDRW